MVEDRDSERWTDVVDAMDDDPIGMRIEYGTEVGGSIIDGELGHGAMGVVYSATHPVIRKRAAIKILRLDVSRSPIAVERFIQEARAVNQIGHPNIIDIFAYGALPDGRAYHVMDLLVGESLRRRLKRGVLHPSEAASVIDEIASALMAAHDNGFVHRDLKPDNVFLVSHDQRWPEVKLLDFGLAKLMPEYGVAAFTTKTGVMLGTPEYMSPEQARGHGVDYRTDIYALGIVMFEILAGNRPFPPLGEPVAILMQHAEEPPLSLADTVAGLPDEMVQLVDAMLAKTPQARPSLAAVRTVIKRLRNTQLPTRSVAGMAMSSFSQLPARPDLAITASRVGAEAVLPEPLTASIRRPPTTPPPHGASTHGASGAARPGPTPGPPAPRSPAPPAPGPTPQRSGLPAALHGLAAAASFPATEKPDITTRGVGVQSMWASQGGVPRFKPTPSPDVPRTPPVGSQPLPSHTSIPSTASSHPAAPTPSASSPSPIRSHPGMPSHARPSHHATANPLGSASSPAGINASALSRPVHQASPPAATSADAPRTSASRFAPTTLGMGPPPKQMPAAQPSPRARRRWLLFAALLVVIAAIALYIVLTT